jgi:hypothetical protein
VQEAEDPVCADSGTLAFAAAGILGLTHAMRRRESSALRWSGRPRSLRSRAAASASRRRRHGRTCARALARPARERDDGVYDRRQSALSGGASSVDKVPMLQYTEEERHRFAEFSELYLTCRCVLRQVFEESGMVASHGSYAWQDDQELLKRDPPVPDPAKHVILVTVQPHLYAASEQIGALSALYSREEVLLGPLVLARSAIEYCAHALWILEDPNEEAEARVARAFLDELRGARQALNQAAHQFGQESDVCTGSGSRYGRTSRVPRRACSSPRTRIPPINDGSCWVGRVSQATLSSS